ncbi:RelA/SpoT domain-containing protein [Vibrio harveyi]
MASEQYSDQKRPLKSSKKQIDKAARRIRHGVDGQERIGAIEKIQEFREYHLYPLMLLKNHLVRTARKVNPEVVVARRLKQLSTIIDKLERPTLDGKSANAIKLTRMQDIAGCRAIVDNDDELYQLRDKLLKSKSVHKVIYTSDYLSEPKKSGYGGYHIVYSCYEHQKEPHPWMKARVEIQIRTQLQHAWATSLEIIDSLEGINLKTSIGGHVEWRRYFKILGKLVAHEESFCTLSEDEYANYLGELMDLGTDLNVLKKLNDYSIALSASSASAIPKSKRSSKGLFLILINKGSENKKIKVLYFKPKEASEALSILNTNEIQGKFDTAVLLSAEDARSLRQAYPNYFGSTELLQKFIVSKELDYLRRGAEAIKTQHSDLLEQKREALDILKHFETDSGKHDLTEAQEKDLIKLNSLVVELDKLLQASQVELDETDKYIHETAEKFGISEV